MYYDWIQEHKRLIIIAGLLLLGVLITWGMVTYISRIGKIGVTISTVPSDATVLVNNTPTHAGTQWLAPGTYTIRASKEGFATSEKKVNASTAKEQNVVAMALTPQSDAAKQWASQHQDEYKNNEIYGAIEARENGAAFAVAHPITKALPYTDPYYQISYRRDGDESIILTVSTDSPRYRYFAVKKLRELGYEPTDFIIEFTNFKNPLEVK